MTKINPVCGSCGETKNKSDFYADRKKIKGLSTYCKACCKQKAKASYALDREGHKRRHREWVGKNQAKVRTHKIKSAYGITPEEFSAIPKVCMVCGVKTNLCIDHSHQSQRVRGMLCQSCNKGLGFFRDNPTLLYRAADYVLGAAKPDIFDATYEPVE